MNRNIELLLYIFYENKAKTQFSQPITLESVILLISYSTELV